MKRPMITIDECMSMSEKELNEFLDRDEKLLAEGLIDENQPNVDFQEMTTEDIVKKYNCIPMEDVFQGIRNKLGKTNI